MDNKKDIIGKILEMELEMFLTVPTAQKSSCQEYPDSFRLHRSAQFSAWSEKTLKSYLKDLYEAVEQGINLMTVKYSRMDNLIPMQNVNPVIDQIISLQYEWQEEMIRKYPNLMSRARPLTGDDAGYGISFETYLRGELETYSNETLALLYSDMIEKHDKGINMSEEVYEYLVKEFGYDSIEAVEQQQ